MRECLLHQVEAKFERRSAGAGQLLEHARIVRRIDHHQDVAKVLGSRPDHARAADIDLLYQTVEGCVRVGCRFGEGIEVDHNEVDWGNALPADRREVILSASTGENARVDGGVERFYTSIHHLGETGHVGHVHDGEPGGGQRFCRATRRHELDPQPSQSAPELDESGLLRDAQ